MQVRVLGPFRLEDGGQDCGEHVEEVLPRSAERPVRSCQQFRGSLPRRRHCFKDPVQRGLDGCPPENGSCFDLGEEQVGEPGHG